MALRISDHGNEIYRTYRMNGIATILGLFLLLLLLLYYYTTTTDRG